MDSSLHALQTELEDILADLQRTERKVRSALTTLDSEVSQRAVAGSASAPPLERKSRGPVQSTRDPTRSAASLDSQRASKAAEGLDSAEFGSAPRTARSDTDDIECGKIYYRKNYGKSGEKIRVNKKVKMGLYEITRIKKDGTSGTKNMTIGALRAILGDMARETGEWPFLTDAQRWPHTLYVNTLTGETVSVRVNQDDTILDVKKSIESARGTAVKAQTLYVRQTELKDTDIVSECIGQRDDVVLLSTKAGPSEIEDIDSEQFPSRANQPRVVRSDEAYLAPERRRETAAITKEKLQRMMQNVASRA